MKNDSKFDEEIRGNVARGRYGRDTLKTRENGSKLLEKTWHAALGNVPRSWQKCANVARGSANVARAKTKVPSVAHVSGDVARCCL